MIESPPLFAVTTSISPSPFRSATATNSGVSERRIGQPRLDEEGARARLEQHGDRVAPAVGRDDVVTTVVIDVPDGHGDRACEGIQSHRTVGVRGEDARLTEEDRHLVAEEVRHAEVDVSVTVQVAGRDLLGRGAPARRDRRVRIEREEPRVNTRL